jgi:nucleoside-diphosphate-sugar epimerase
MKIVIVGASGRIGSKVAEMLSANHEVLRVGARTGDVLCDHTDPDSVRRLFEQTGTFDSMIAVVGGDSVFKGYRDLVDEDFRFGFERKFLGQARLVRLGERFAHDEGSFTLSSGFLSDYPNDASIATGPLNAAVDTFVQNTAPLLPRGLRLNVVSPAPVVEPEQEERGLITVDQAAEAHVNAVESDFTGEVLRVWGGLSVHREKSHQANAEVAAKDMGRRQDPDEQRSVRAGFEKRIRTVGCGENETAAHERGIVRNGCAP